MWDSCKCQYFAPEIFFRKGELQTKEGKMDGQLVNFNCILQTGTIWGPRIYCLAEWVCTCLQIADWCWETWQCEIWRVEGNSNKHMGGFSDSLPNGNSMFSAFLFLASHLRLMKCILYNRYFIKKYHIKIT